MRHLFEKIELKVQEGRMGRLVRRVSVAVLALMFVTYLGDIIAVLYSGSGAGRVYGWTGFIVAMTAMGMCAFFSRFLRRSGLAVGNAVTWDERAQLDFAKPYAKLSERHKFDVRVRAQREARKAPPPQDEREKALQHEAERRSLQLLRSGAPFVVIVYWIACLSLPGGPVRVGLLIGASVISFLAIPVMVLPDLIRLWTEPEAPPELSVIAINGEA